MKLSKVFFAVLTLYRVSMTDIKDSNKMFNYTGTKESMKYSFNSKYGNMTWNLSDGKNGAIEVYLAKLLSTLFVSNFLLNNFL